MLVRKRTTGIIEEHFIIRSTKFHIFDVGGQRNERKKWMHCFERVTAVIFVASLSSYNEVLLEDETVTVMNEEINLFENICNSRWFTDTAFILFLNKRDLFELKFKTNQIPLRKCFSDFHGDQNELNRGMEFIKKKYLSRNNSAQKQIYCHVECLFTICIMVRARDIRFLKLNYTLFLCVCHCHCVLNSLTSLQFTCATDKDNVTNLFNDVQQVVINTSLKVGGLI